MMVRRGVQLMKLLLLCFTAFALLVVRTADAHVHLCFDGMEPPTSLRVFDQASPWQGGDSTHQDRDVDALGAVLGTKIAQGESWAPLPPAEVILLRLPLQPVTESEVATQNPSPKLPDLFLPLLRGPPA